MEIELIVWASADEDPDAKHCQIGVPSRHKVLSVAALTEGTIALIDRVTPFQLCIGERGYLCNAGIVKGRQVHGSELISEAMTPGQRVDAICKILEGLPPELKVNIMSAEAALDGARL